MAKVTYDIKRLEVHDQDRSVRYDTRRFVVGQAETPFVVSTFEQMFQSLDQMFQGSEPMVQSS